MPDKLWRLQLASTRVIHVTSCLHCPVTIEGKLGVTRRFVGCSLSGGCCASLPCTWLPWQLLRAVLYWLGVCRCVSNFQISPFQCDLILAADPSTAAAMPLPQPCQQSLSSRARVYQSQA